MPATTVSTSANPAVGLYFGIGPQSFAFLPFNSGWLRTTSSVQRMRTPDPKRSVECSVAVDVAGSDILNFGNPSLVISECVFNGVAPSYQAKAWLWHPNHIVRREARQPESLSYQNRQHD